MYAVVGSSFRLDLLLLEEEEEGLGSEEAVNGFEDLLVGFRAILRMLIWRVEKS